MRQWIWWLTVPLLYVPSAAWAADTGVLMPGKVGTVDLGRAPNMGVSRSSTMPVPFDVSKHHVVGMSKQEPGLLYKLAGLLPDFTVRKKAQAPMGAMPQVQFQGKVK